MLLKDSIMNTHTFKARVLVTELKVGQMTWTIWVTWVTFGGSNGSHLQTKLCGCDPDITCSLENNVSIW